MRLNELATKDMLKLSNKFVVSNIALRFSAGLMLTTPTGATPTNQRLCVATEQECTSAVETSSTTVSGERSCDKSHDSSESDDESYTTPPTTPVDKETVLVSRNILILS